MGQFHYATRAVEPLGLFLILRAFASGCSAMTGVEAISNGVPAFKKPETRNAAITLTWMAVILGSLFVGITLLIMTYAVAPDLTGQSTVIARPVLKCPHGMYCTDRKSTRLNSSH